ncbi:MAG: DUF3467 domain-containing protein [Bacteroidia bacterium]|nr:DUF3467 domain-containing protein [Bacteroidia bacterium]MDW8157808.1 DUF3467 domain-containing protein [Bacteroidia bacterium]
MAEDTPRPNEFNVEITEEIADGIYSNMVIISHSNAEFIFDFIRIVPGIAKAKVKSRVIMTPQHAKRLLLTMQDNLQKYEATFGTIELKDNIDTGAGPFGFGPPAGMA